MNIREEMPFPKRKWKDIAKKLGKSSCSSVRSCDQLGKYTVGDSYSTPWGDIIKNEEVARYSKAEDIPTWHLMDKGMKISIRKREQHGSS